MLDSTKLIPEELVPVRPVGRMVLNRNPDNFFAETEQVAFCTAHIVPGIDFSNDPLLEGRIHSYVDTQISRLGGPNFHEIPINAPVAQVHNNQRDGMHRQAIARGVSPTSRIRWRADARFRRGGQDSCRSPSRLPDDKVRGKPEKFAEHYAQATLFWNSQTAVEQQHIIRAYRFELTKVQTAAVRRRVVAQLRNVDEGLARAVAEGLGLDELPEALPLLVKPPAKPEVAVSEALSLISAARQGRHRDAAYCAHGRRRRQTVAEVSKRPAGTDGPRRRAAGDRRQAGRGQVTADDADLEIEVSMETAPSVLWDALIVFGTTDKSHPLAQSGHAKEFLKDQYRHCKPILLLGSAASLLAEAGIPQQLPSKKADPGLLVVPTLKGPRDLDAFIAAVAKHRHFERETDPPRV